MVLLNNLHNYWIPFNTYTQQNMNSVSSKTAAKKAMTPIAINAGNKLNWGGTLVGQSAAVSVN